MVNYRSDFFGSDGCRLGPSPGCTMGVVELFYRALEAFGRSLRDEGTRAIVQQVNVVELRPVFAFERGRPLQYLSYFPTAVRIEKFHDLPSKRTA